MRCLRLAPGAVGDEQQQREQDEVRDDRRPAVGDERQRDAGQRDELRDAADDDEDLQREHGGQAGREQLGERVRRDHRGLEAALDDQQVDEQHRGAAEQPELVDDDREDEVRVRRGQDRRRVAELDDRLAEALAEQPAVGLRVDRLRDLVAAADRLVVEAVVERVQPRVDAVLDRRADRVQDARAEREQPEPDDDERRSGSSRRR